MAAKVLSSCKVFHGCMSRQCIVHCRSTRGFSLTYSTSSQYYEGNTSNTREKQIGVAGEDAPSSGSSLYLTGFGVFFMTVGGYFLYHSSERQSPIKARKPDAKISLTDVRTTLGGPFTLIDSSTGEVVTDQTFKGQWTVIYFGYTSCPEDCPQELEKLGQVIDLIDRQTDHMIQPVFITIDPKRDSTFQLKAYLSEFHPRIIGLTGSADDIRQVAREYRVFYKKIEEEGPDYLVDHSNFLYLMDQNMKFVKFFGREYDANNLVADIIKEIKKEGK